MALRPGRHRRPHRAPPDSDARATLGSERKTLTCAGRTVSLIQDTRRRCHKISVLCFVPFFIK